MLETTEGHHHARHDINCSLFLCLADEGHQADPIRCPGWLLVRYAGDVQKRRQVVADVGRKRSLAVCLENGAQPSLDGSDSNIRNRNCTFTSKLHQRILP